MMQTWCTLPVVGFGAGAPGAYPAGMQRWPLFSPGWNVALFASSASPGAGVATGMFCGLILGYLQIPGTLLVCAWLRGNIVAGAWPRSIPTPHHPKAAVCAGFYLGALVVPG